MERGTSEEGAGGSPLAAVRNILPAPELLSLGPIRFLLVAGEKDDGAWGLLGAFWRTIDGEEGGFLVSPDALWAGSEMVRSFRGAESRGWTVDRIYAYWQVH